LKILIVGGTGLSGAHAALYLRDAGHEVTLVSRTAPANPVLSDFGHIAGNYVEDGIPVEALSGFDALVFAASADIRRLPDQSSRAACSCSFSYSAMASSIGISSEAARG